VATRAQWVAAGVLAGVVAVGVYATVVLAPDVFPVTVGSTAPPFRAVTLAKGDTVSLERYQGDVVLLNVWATWCLPCEQEMPSMQRLHEDLGAKGLHIVAVSIDKDPRDEVQAWIDKRHLTFEVLHDQSGRIQQIYQTTGVPESFILDRRGVIIKKVIGATDWQEPGTRALLLRLMQQRDTSTSR
jgi:peroxiredoxin